MCKQPAVMPGGAGGCMLITLPDVLRGERCSAFGAEVAGRDASTEAERMLGGWGLHART